MNKQLLFSKESAEKTFGGLYNNIVIIEPGKNWIDEEQLTHLQKKSEGFQHFVKHKFFLLKTGENAVREETSKEKKHRLTLMERGKQIINKIKFTGNDNFGASPDTQPDLEDFTKSLKIEAEKERSLFADFLRAVSVDIEKEVIEKIQKAASDCEGATVESMKTVITDAGNTDIKDMKTAITGAGNTELELFKKSFDEIVKVRLEAFESILTKMIETFLNKFTADLEKTSESKRKTFEKKVKTIANRARQNQDQ